MRKHLRVFLTTLLLAVSMLTTTVLADESTIVESFVTDDTVYMYVSGVSENPESIEYQIGTTKVEATSMGYANPIKTIILWDNSVSVMSKNDKTVREFLVDLCANKERNEVIAIYAINDATPQQLCDYTDNYDTLKDIVSNTEVQNKDAFLIENLKSIVEGIKSEEDGMAFHRIIVISDGMDTSTSEGGVTRSELDKVLEKNNYPIYTIAVNGKDENALKEMFSLSRASGVPSFKFDGSNASDIRQTIRNDAGVVGFKAEIPNDLRNGSTAMTKLKVDGASIEADVTMPLADPAAEPEKKEPEELKEIETHKKEEPEEEEEEDIPEPEIDEKSGNVFMDMLQTIIDTVTLTGLIIIACVVVALIALILILVLLSKSKKRKALEADEERINMYEQLDREIDNGWKYQDTDKTEMYTAGDEEGTMLLFGTPTGSGRVVILSSVDHPGVSYSAPLNGVISVGRETYNTITIENDRSVSKRHAEIYEMNGEVYIKDVGSSNGTFMGPKDVNPRITGPERLVNNATITIGQSLYSVNIM